MKRLGGILAVAGLALAIAPSLWADGEALASRMESGWSPCVDDLYSGVDSQGWKIYAGLVEKVERRGNPEADLQLILRSNGRPIKVQLGPAWFLDRQTDSLKAGDRVEVHGYYSAWDSQEIIVAASVRRGNDELRLLDRDGTPFWCAWRRLAAGR